MHLAREARGGELAAAAGYYVYDYDTVVWAVATVLAQLTDLREYHDLVRTFLRAWVQLEPPRRDPVLVRDSSCLGPAAIRLIVPPTLVSQGLAVSALLFVVLI